MAREFSRTDRIADQMQRELALLIQQEMRDPRVGMVTVAAVELSRDLSVAKVFVSVLGDAEQAQAALAVLKKAAGFLRHELGRRMIVRALPELRFVHDTTSERGAHLSALIDQAVAKDRKEDSED
ncbi:MAG: 30S ribosome-binding factor RbfA [Gammaproteobacteria bacterium]|nr:30S ribosome-binding factor RbfA [Gammaproteobacteria bacterium]